MSQAKETEISDHDLEAVAGGGSVRIGKLPETQDFSGKAQSKPSEVSATTTSVGSPTGYDLGDDFAP